MFARIISELRAIIGHKLINYTKHMPTMTSKQLLSPPDCVRGMVNLDRDMFKKSISVPYIRVNEKHLEHVLKHFNPLLLKIENFNSIEAQDNSETKSVILNPELVSSIDDITDEKKKVLELYDAKQLFFKDILLTYDNFDFSAIFRAILPEGEENVSSFSRIGHILHLNLRSHSREYKHLIGSVLLDKVKKADLVVNKLNQIENEFRIFNMEVLAKRNDDVNTIVKVKDIMLNYEFDFAKVYWNPRLEIERRRILSKLQPDCDIVYDVFAGVGPFSLPAAKTLKCSVLANDLNPESYKWLQHNIKLNKTEDRVTAYNMDGNDFIRNVIANDLLNKMLDPNFNEFCVNEPQFHVIMNLPAMATQFLPSFKSLLPPANSISTKKLFLPFVHLYLFIKGDPPQPEKVIIDNVREILEIDSLTVKEVYNVRTVSPNKDMFRISFIIPEEVLYKQDEQEDELQTKRQRIE